MVQPYTSSVTSQNAHRQRRLEQTKLALRPENLRLVWEVDTALVEDDEVIEVLHSLYDI